VLGNACARGCYRFDTTDPNNVLTRAARELAGVGAGVALIAEPWAAGAPGSYQLGHFPAGWSEWNGQFRDTIREHQNDASPTVTPSTLEDYLSGSPSLFQKVGRAPASSINYVVSHDGFTMHDLYTCAAQNDTQAWPYGPSNGGGGSEHEWDQNGDGPMQRRAVRTGLALLAVSVGVPMITGGDEIARSVRCNDNPYNLDSPGNWLDWSALANQSALFTFAARLFAFRSAHPALRPRAYRTGTDPDGNGLKDVTWLRADAAEIDAAYANDRASAFLGFRVDGEAAGDSVRSIYVAINGGAPLGVTLPPEAPGKAWYRAADTSLGEGFAAPGTEVAIAPQTAYGLADRSVGVFVER
jgi:glycogen operon protein